MKVLGANDFHLKKKSCDVRVPAVHLSSVFSVFVVA